MHRLVDGAHAAAAQPLDEPILAKLRGKRRLRGGKGLFRRKGTVPFSPRHDFGQGNRTAAFRLVQEGLRNGRSSKLAD